MSEHRLDRIIIERPRGGRRISSTRITGYQKELARITAVASEEGLLQPYLIKTRNRTKYFSDHLAPLRRFLNSKVGKPWDLVYSELCHKLDITTLSGQHILSHLWDFVERYVIFIDGVLYARHRQNYPLVRGQGQWRNRFYIHPETGVLCLIPIAPQERLQLVDDWLWEGSDRCYRQIEGIWYFVTFSSAPIKGKIIDLLLQSELTYSTAQQEYGRPIYACHKRHATKKEIRTIRQKLKARLKSRKKAS
ncbi:hypothetical protein [Oscillatoria sp. FACHB-1406]|uniref:hypothetical protein n=1 Tax=Oscillatoria sp. FACHB-1406 TaxID=2692846 RepID=UPI001688F53E|nr:hypothetical protein [Oscillatoria sp. FACHB-1406]MBD2576131.1 hypothetical protein [Oscillatoria sp. FACHB-1406]